MIIINGIIVDPAQELEGPGTVYIRENRIERVVPGEYKPEDIDTAEEIIDAKGCYVFPGCALIFFHQAVDNAADCVLSVTQDKHIRADGIQDVDMAAEGIHIKDIITVIAVPSPADPDSLGNHFVNRHSVKQFHVCLSFS